MLLGGITGFIFPANADNVRQVYELEGTAMVSAIEGSDFLIKRFIITVVMNEAGMVIDRHGDFLSQN